MNDTASNASIVVSQSTNYTSAFTQRTPPADDKDGTESEFHCICGYYDDDGFSVQCDKCDKWQHMKCLKMNENNLPPTFICCYCGGDWIADGRAAREAQRARKEQESKNHKKKVTTTGRKRDKNITSYSRSTTEDKAGERKPSSPKDSSSSRPRAKQRNTNNTNPQPDTALSPAQTSPSDQSPGAEADIESESEVPASVYTREYTHVSSNTILSSEVESELKNLILKPDVARQHKQNYTPPRRVSRSVLSQLDVSSVCVRRLSGSARSVQVGAPLNYITSETTKQLGELVLEYIGEIGSKESYINDSLNQFQIIRHPKPFVLFHPDLPMYIDARQCGSESRFVRHSCKPNLKLETVILDDTEIRFGLFACEHIESGTELTINWEWEPSFKKALYEKSELPPAEASKFSVWSEKLVTSLGECACLDKKTCLLEKYHDESKSTKSTRTKKSNGKRRRNASIDFSNTKETSPEFTNVEERANRRSSSTSSRDKPTSRDMTPSHHTHDPTTHDHIESAREARKIKETISLIEKMNSQDVQSRKRIKRPSGTVPHPHAIHQSMDDLRSGNGHPTLTNGLSHSSPRSGSPSPSIVTSIDERNVGHTIQTSNPTISLRSTTVYCESSVQADMDVHPPVIPVAPRRKRILAVFRAQQMQSDRTTGAPLTIVKEESSPTDIKIAHDGDVFMSGVKDDKEESTNSSFDENMNQATDANLTTHIQPRDNLDEPIRQYNHLNGPVNVFKSPPLKQASPPSSNIHINGYRSSDLHLQMPPAQLFPNAPTTPSLMSSSSSNDHQASNYLVQSPMGQASSIIPTFSTQTSTDSLMTPSLLASSTPAKKKMSLSEYGKRRKAESTEKEKEKEKVAVVPLPAVTSEDTALVDGETRNLEKDSTPMEVDSAAPVTHNGGHDEEMQGVTS